MKTFNIVTIFPEMVSDIFSWGVISRGVKEGLISINPVNLRDFTHDKHKKVDDYQYGGGQGLLLKPEPIVEAVEYIKEKQGNTRVILLDPRGKKFDQKKAEELSNLDNITFICGRYEGVDERVRALVVDEEISIGDFVLTGGELASCVIIDAVARLVEGVLGDEFSSVEESFSEGTIEFPHYTRPAVYKGLRVPDELISGDHKKINEWRMKESLKITLQNRPDLLNDKTLTPKEKEVLLSVKDKTEKRAKIYVGLFHYPMRDKHGFEVATSITNMDLHDISRSCRTYGVERYFVVTPLEAQREIAQRVLSHWQEGFGATYNPNRREAFEYTVITESLVDVISYIEEKEGSRPLLIVTSAREAPGNVKLDVLLKLNIDKPLLLMFGTGWGFSPEVMKLADYTLEPIKGAKDFNHLSVRSAVVIYLDRINSLFRRI